MDAAIYAQLWEDLYDKKLKPDRSIALFLRALDIPGIGPQDSSNSMVYGIWDVQTNHATVFAEAGDYQPFYVKRSADEGF